MAESKKGIFAKLLKKMGSRLGRNISLSGYSTMGVGGQALYLGRPVDIEELQGLMELASCEKLPLFVLGGGSNILFDDQGLSAVVLKLGRGFDQFSLAGEGRITVGGALSSASLVNQAAKNGLCGAEFLAGLPGTVGGAVCMNAGGVDKAIGNLVEGLTVIDLTGKKTELKAEALKFSYRNSNIKSGVIIIGAELKLDQLSEEEVLRKTDFYRKKRSESQPLGAKSLGCVFKNPPGDSAGRMIDELGFKGRYLGGAMVSLVHANFIVNEKGARAAEIVELMLQIRDKVRQVFGVVLEPEIKIVGKNGEDNWIDHNV